METPAHSHANRSNNAQSPSLGRSAAANGNAHGEHYDRGDVVNYESYYADHTEAKQDEFEVECELFPIRLSREFESSPR
jgi:hypothetical protein